MTFIKLDYCKKIIQKIGIIGDGLTGNLIAIALFRLGYPVELVGKKGLDENLNTPGMKFFPIAFEDSCQLPASSSDPDSITNRLYFYGVIARLATLAAAKEMQR